MRLFAQSEDVIMQDYNQSDNPVAYFYSTFLISFHGMTPWHIIT